VFHRLFRSVRGANNTGMVKPGTEQAPHIDIECKQCSKGFRALVSDVNRGQRRFCSTDCRNDSMRTPDPYRAFEYEPTTGCWLWYLATNDAGYGSFRVNGKTVLAHRKFFERTKGPIPNGFHVCHKCDTPQCVNPDHLFLGTASDNMRDMHKKGRWKPLDLKVGVRHPMSKLTEDDVRLIRASEKSLPVLAAQFRVHAATIRSVRQGKTYANVTTTATASVVA
jgi:hypothetical protein